MLSGISNQQTIDADFGSDRDVEDILSLSSTTNT